MFRFSLIACALMVLAIPAEGCGKLGHRLFQSRQSSCASASTRTTAVTTTRSRGVTLQAPNCANGVCEPLAAPKKK